MELSKWQSKETEDSSYASYTSTTGFYRFPISRIDVSKGLKDLDGPKTHEGHSAVTTGLKSRRKLPKIAGVCTIPRQGTGQR